VNRVRLRGGKDLHGCRSKQDDLEGGDALKIRVYGHDREVAFYGGSGNEGIYITNQAFPMWLPEPSSDISIPLQNGVGEKVGVHFAK
jgi:hypothetical protein